MKKIVKTSNFCSFDYTILNIIGSRFCSKNNDNLPDKLEDNKSKSNIVNKAHIQNNIQFLKEKRFDNLVEEEILRDVNSEVNKKIFDKIFTSDAKNANDTSVDTNIIKFDSSSSLSDNRTVFTTTLDRTLNLSDNKDLADLLFENKLDLSKENYKLKSLNLNDKELTGDSNDTELFEIDLGKIKSFPNIANGNLDKDIVDIIKKDKDYEYDVSVIGKKVNDESDDDLSLRSYVALNEENKHYMSPVIFHDERENKKEKIKYEETVFTTIIKNPFLMITFIILGYYIYPNLWKKDYFMALSEDYNNFSLVGSHDRNLYDYINYRRGLYVSVRSNFS